MPEFIEAARVDQIPPGTGTTVKVAGKDVAIFNVDGEVYAIGDSCVHAGASLGRAGSTAALSPVVRTAFAMM